MSGAFEQSNAIVARGSANANNEQWWRLLANALSFFNAVKRQITSIKATGTPAPWMLGFESIFGVWIMFSHIQTMQAFATKSTLFICDFVPMGSFVFTILPHAECKLTIALFQCITRFAAMAFWLDLHQWSFLFLFHHGSTSHGAWQWLLSHMHVHRFRCFGYNIQTLCSRWLAAIAANVAGIHCSNIAKFIDAAFPNVQCGGGAFLFAHATWIVVDEATCIQLFLRLLLCCIFERFHHAFIMHAKCNKCNTKAQKKPPASTGGFCCFCWCVD